MRPWIAFIVGALIGGLGIAFWIESTRDTEIMFPSKMLVNYGDRFTLDGSIVGEGADRAVNGTVSITCAKSTMQCAMWSINQIGERQVSSLYRDTLYIKRWEDNIVRLTSLHEDANNSPCNYFEIRIDLSTQDATYTRIPNEDSSSPNCDMFDQKVYQWRIDDSYSRLKLNKQILSESE